MEPLCISSFLSDVDITAPTELVEPSADFSFYDIPSVSYSSFKEKSALTFDDLREFEKSRIAPYMNFNMPKVRGRSQWRSVERPSPPKPYCELTSQQTQRAELRWKQVVIGLRTCGFRNFVKAFKNGHALIEDGIPILPDIYQNCSKREFDRQLGSWRKMLHQYDKYDSSAAASASSVTNGMSDEELMEDCEGVEWIPSLIYDLIEEDEK